MFLNYVILVASVFGMGCKCFPMNDSAVISTYAKVARWGAATEKPESEGRSHSGQTLWTHRSDVKIIGGQNLKKPSVVYQYPVQKVGSGRVEPYPAVGEVQERFNPRPYFDYSPAPQKTQRTESKNRPAPAPAAPTPTFDSFPVFQQPLDSPPSADLYTNGYSSYVPPISGPVGPPNDKPSGVQYPPNGAPPSESSGDNAPSGGYTYNKPQEKPEGPPAYPSLGPPLAPADDAKMPPNGDSGDDDSDHDFFSHHKEPIYYPPSNHEETILDHPPPGWKEPEQPSGDMGDMGDMMGDNKGKHQETILDHPPPGWEEPKQNGGDMAGMMMGGMMNGMMKGNGNGNGHDMAEDDLSPPPAAPASDFGGHNFPNYLYSDPHGQGHDFGSYDFDHHHVYKEVTTTTTEAPEDERVNKGQYSYFFLGRKLWYIPLYFSVYFIIYVTVLILKSIARHKIQLKHEHFTRDNKARSLNLDDIHQNVTEAIEHARRKFTYVAM